MSNMEFNKVFAAVLVAGITAMLCGFVSKNAFETEDLEKDAVTIEVAATSQESPGSDASPKLPEPILALLASADIEKGAKVSKACAACHSFDKGGPAKQGPSLWGVVGSPKASKAGFEYSADMKAVGGNWDYASLNTFLTKPKAYIAGTKMTFIGIKKPEDRAAVIAWLRTLADTPVALPTEAEIAAENPGATAPAVVTTPDASAPAATENNTPAEENSSPDASKTETPAPEKLGEPTEKQP